MYSRSRSRSITAQLNAPITVVPDLQCPTCKEPELNPDTGKLNFRGLKVMDEHGYWWSHCLTCDEWF